MQYVPPLLLHRITIVAVIAAAAVAVVIVVVTVGVGVAVIGIVITGPKDQCRYILNAHTFPIGEI